MVDQEQEKFRSGRIMIYTENDSASRSCERAASIAYIVLVTVKHKARNSKISWSHNVEDNEMVENLGQFEISYLHTCKILN